MPRRIKREKLPQVGMVFEKTVKGRNIAARVVSVKPSIGRVILEVNGKEYQSPSAAAKALTGYEINGWLFWGLDKKKE